MHPNQAETDHAKISLKKTQILLVRRRKALSVPNRNVHCNKFPQPATMKIRMFSGRVKIEVDPINQTTNAVIRQEAYCYLRVNVAVMTCPRTVGSLSWENTAYTGFNIIQRFKKRTCCRVVLQLHSSQTHFTAGIPRARRECTNTTDGLLATTTTTTTGTNRAYCTACKHPPLLPVLTTYPPLNYHHFLHHFPFLGVACTGCYVKGSTARSPLAMIYVNNPPALTAAPRISARSRGI
ncbi:hypothetical protein J6590_002756 [Homalodisca vitripennis]|nr:hypothetical protein J6590_002756 [Homalodisca vitripennis]